MRYLLDANVAIGLMRDAASTLAQRVRREKPVDVAISSLVAHRLFYGAFKSRRVEQNVAVIDDLRFVVLEFDKEDARRAGEIRANLAARGTPIGPYDLLIAGQAVARRMILVTHNIGEFSRVPGLRSEDWET
jgi:tRNA(fMet)-specific endonuclease VapC